MRILPLLLASSALWAQSEQKFAELRDLRLESGATLASCRVGFRTYGTLDNARSNAVLFPTWFSGNTESLAAFLGPDKLVDTSRFFVITVDALGNGASCSPSNGPKPFPAITIRDMVHSQYRLLTEHLGIRRLHAVLGISMGGMQTFEWIAAYPAFMDRAVPIIGSPKLTSADLLLWQAELAAIEAVQKAGADPRTVMPAVLAMHQFALTTPRNIVEKTPDSEYPTLQAKLEKDARTGMDPLDWAAQLRAMMAQDISRHYGNSMERVGAAVQAKVLVVVAAQDHMVNPIPALKLASAAGFDVLQLNSDCGHMSTGCEAARLSAAVASFLRENARKRTQ